jgi:acyl-coenzyme A thioesterase PaaI-like protein
MAFDQAAAQRLLGEVFAGWVQDLGLTVEQVGTGSAVLRMRFSERLCRDNGVVCGQAIMSLADTAMVFAVSAAADGDARPAATAQAAYALLAGKA